MIGKELNRLQSAILRITASILEVENERKIIHMQMQNEQKKIDMFVGLMKKEQKFLTKKKDSLYQVEFNLQKCEMRIDRLKGEAEDKTELENKQKRIDELQASLNERMSTSKLLKNQIANLEVKLSRFSSSKLNQEKFD